MDKNLCASPDGAHVFLAISDVQKGRPDSMRAVLGRRYGCPYCQYVIDMFEDGEVRVIKESQIAQEKE